MHITLWSKVLSNLTQRKQCDDFWLSRVERFRTIYNMNDFAVIIFTQPLLYTLIKTKKAREVTDKLASSFLAKFFKSFIQSCTESYWNHLIRCISYYNKLYDMVLLNRHAILCSNWNQSGFRGPDKIRNHLPSKSSIVSKGTNVTQHNDFGHVQGNIN